MILLDPDWNPSNDAQVMGRIWRVGQKREVFIYRFYAANSIEERILDIQRNKENLSDTIIDGKKAASHKRFSDEVIRNLFDFREDDDPMLASEDLDKIATYLKQAQGTEELIAFYDHKVTEFKPEEAERNDFDLNKKEEGYQSSDSDEESTPEKSTGNKK